MKALFFLALLSLGAAQGPFDFTPENICLLMVDGTYIVDPTTCSTYYKCQDGKATPYFCPSGQIFNKNIGICVSSSQSDCGNINTMCVGKSKGTYLPDVNSCRGFYYCNGADAAGIHGNCPGGQNFNPNTQGCVWPSDYACSKTNTMQPICSFVPNGQYFGVNTNCGDWAVCTNGVYSSGPCDQGALFNTQLGVCDQEISEVNCIQVSEPQSNGDNHALQGTDCSSWTSQYIKDPQTCSGFYYCNSQKVALWGQCANNKFYNSDTGNCVDRSTVDCNSSNICENTLGKYKWVNDPLDCHKYYSCSDNVRSPTSSACPNNMWFNEVSQMCTPIRPNYAACVGGLAPVPPTAV